MVKEFSKYMTYGKKGVSTCTGNEYVLIENMDENRETVKAVNTDNLRRYELLSAWISNYENDSSFRERFTKNIESCKDELQGYIEEVNISDIEPSDMIRFITSDYKTKFVVRNLTDVSVNGTVAKVAYIDETHFRFVDNSLVRIFGVLHICEFAEICERHGSEVKPVL